MERCSRFAADVLSVAQGLLPLCLQDAVRVKKIQREAQFAKPANRAASVRNSRPIARFFLYGHEEAPSEKIRLMRAKKSTGFAGAL